MARQNHSKSDRPGVPPEALPVCHFAPQRRLAAVRRLHNSAHATRNCQFATNTARKVPASLPRNRTSPAESEALTRVPAQSIIQECSPTMRWIEQRIAAIHKFVSSSRGDPRERTGRTRTIQTRTSQQARERGLIPTLANPSRSLCNFPSIPPPKHRPFAWRDAQNGANHQNARHTHRSLSQPGSMATDRSWFRCCRVVRSASLYTAFRGMFP